MVMNDFLETTERIERFFEKEYNQEQRKMLFETFKDKSKERYRQVALNVFKTCKFLPKLADLIEIEKNLPQQKKETEKVECKYCNGTGFITYKKIIPNGDEKLEYIYAARCSCSNGEQLSDEIPYAAELGIENHIPRLD